MVGGGTGDDIVNSRVKDIAVFVHNSPPCMLPIYHLRPRWRGKEKPPKKGFEWRDTPGRTGKAPVEA
jgi:hypothetical protein